MIASTLEEASYETVIENRGARGYETACQARPDLILLDINMPQVSGPELAAQLKENPATAEIPIIFLTGEVLDEEVQAAGGYIGGYPFIAKPATLQEILECIQKHLR